MKGKECLKVVLGATFLMVLAGAALAQGTRQPWRSEGPGRGPAPQERYGPERGEPGRPYAPGQEVEAVAVKVKQQKNGVSIAVTSDKPAVAERIKKVLPEFIESMRNRRQDRRERIQERGGDRRPGEGTQPGNLLASKALDVQVEQIDGGVLITVTSDNPKVAERIKVNLPKRLQFLRQLVQARRDRREQPLQNLPPGAVDVDVLPTEKGVVVVISSDNPRVAQAIREQLPERIKMLMDLGRARQELREERQPRPGQFGEGGPQGPLGRVPQRRQMRPYGGEYEGGPGSGPRFMAPQAPRAHEAPPSEWRQWEPPRDWEER